MCGRFGIPNNHVSMIDTFRITTDLGLHTDWKTLMPTYNLAPTDQIPVIFDSYGQRCVAAMRWGLIPLRTVSVRGRTALDVVDKPINTPINARSETVHSLGVFKSSFESRRCLIPVGGFYEWNREKKLPYWISFKEEFWMGLAGIYSWWWSQEGKWMPSCTIITTTPNSFMESIHDRMPVILTEETFDFWLNRDNLNTSKLKKLLVPCSSKKMQAHQVSLLVNKVDNDGPELIEPNANMVREGI